MNLDIIATVGLAILTVLLSVIAYALKRGVDAIDRQLAEHDHRLDLLEQASARLDERHNAVTAVIDARLEAVEKLLDKIFDKLDENDRNLAILWKTSKNCKYNEGD